MFTDTSRYAKTATETVTDRDGREVQAIRLRALPQVTGRAVLVKEGSRLDVLAQEHYGDGSRFWHIADANTALEAADLVAEVLATLRLPEG